MLASVEQVQATWFTALPPALIRQIDQMPLVFEEGGARVYVRDASVDDWMWEPRAPDDGLNMLGRPRTVHFTEIEYRTLQVLRTVLAVVPHPEQIVIWDDHGGTWWLSDFLEHLEHAT